MWVILQVSFLFVVAACTPIVVPTVEPSGTAATVAIANLSEVRGGEPWEQFVVESSHS